MARERAAGRGHAERLSPLDVALLNSETPTQHRHVGGVFVFEVAPGDTFDFEHLQRLVRSRIHLVPRYRQKLHDASFGLDQPVWVDDPTFDLAYHLRHAALPRPGGMDQLLEYAARLMSRQLDRDRPLWELYVVDGLADGRVALVAKHHHAMVDGMGGVEIMNVLVDRDPSSADTIPDPRPWDPRPAPSAPARVAAALRTVITRPTAVAGALRGVVDRPLELVTRLASVGRDVLATTWSLVGVAPRSVLNQEPGIQRRMALVDLELGPIREIKDAFGTTVNDVVLTIVGDMLGRYLRHRHQSTRGVDLRAIVPVSVHAGDAASGGEVTSVLLDLPVDEMDPVVRLRLVRERVGNLRASHAAIGADALRGLSGFAPATLQAMAARTAISQRLYNVLVANVPGPHGSVHVLGATLVGAYPFVPLGVSQALGIGLISLGDTIHVGFTADYDAVPDVSILPDLLTAAVDELHDCALALHR